VLLKIELMLPIDILLITQNSSGINRKYQRNQSSETGRYLECRGHYLDNRKAKFIKIALDLRFFELERCHLQTLENCDQLGFIKKIGV
jgi:hypothetical protein